jgi:hypothetical protein
MLTVRTRSSAAPACPRFRQQGHGNIATTSGYLHARPDSSSGLRLDLGVVSSMKKRKRRAKRRSHTRHKSAEVLAGDGSWGSGQLTGSANTVTTAGHAFFAFESNPASFSQSRRTRYLKWI